MGGPIVGPLANALSSRARRDLLDSKFADVFAVPGNSPFEPFAQIDLGLPPGFCELRDIKQFLRDSVGLRGVPVRFAFVADQGGNGLGDLADRHIGAAPDVDLLRAVVVFEKVEARIGHVIRMEELAPRATSPQLVTDVAPVATASS